MTVEKEKDFELPAWSDDVSKETRLVAWAILQLARETYGVADAIDALYNRLDGIEKSLDAINEELPMAGMGR
jgi:hypothetical protein